MNYKGKVVAWPVVGVVLLSVVAITILLVVGLPGKSSPESAAQSNRDPAPAAGSGMADSTPRVKVVKPSREYLKRVSTPQPAHVEPYEKTDIHAKISGYLEVIGPVLGADGKPVVDRDGKPRPLDIGDRVVKGQVLAELSVPEMEQERAQKAALVDQAKAALGQAKASLTAAEALVEAADAKIKESRSQLARYAADLAYRRSEHKRYAAMVRERSVRKELEDEKLNQLRAAEASQQSAKATVATAEATLKVEQARLIRARADVTSADAHLKVAQANLEYAAIMLNYRRIQAPFDGVITRRRVDTGAFIQSAATGKPHPLFSLARVDRLRIVADVPEVEAGLVKIGQPATFQMNAMRSQPLPGKVVRFADALDTGSRTMRVEVELDSPPKSLRPGMFGSVTILLADAPDALLIPTSALLTDGKPAVLVVEEGQARRQEVELGLSEGGRVQVLAGLSADQQVIAAGMASVREGQAVEVVR